MKRTDEPIWPHILHVLNPSPTDQQIGLDLLTEYHSGGCLRRTCAEIMRLPLAAFAVFYAHLPKPPARPIRFQLDGPD